MFDLCQFEEYVSCGVLPWVYPVWDCLGFLVLGGYFLPHFRTLLTIITSSIFLCPFFLFSSFVTTVIQMLGHLTLSQRFLILSFFFYLNHFFPFCFFYFPLFCLPAHLPSLLPQLFYCCFPPECFDLSYCIIHCFFLIFSSSLLSISCIFSILLSSLFTCNSVFCLFFFNVWKSWLSLFWVLFQVDSISLPLLFVLVSFYHVPLPAEYFSAFFFRLLCLGALPAGWNLVFSLHCGDCSLWVGLVKWLVKVSFLGNLCLYYSVWIWISSLWNSMKCPVVSLEISMDSAWLWAASFIYLFWRE